MIRDLSKMYPQTRHPVSGAAPAALSAAGRSEGAGGDRLVAIFLLLSLKPREAARRRSPPAPLSRGGEPGGASLRGGGCGRPQAGLAQLADGGPTPWRGCPRRATFDSG